MTKDKFQFEATGRVKSYDPRRGIALVSLGDEQEAEMHIGVFSGRGTGEPRVGDEVKMTLVPKRSWALVGRLVKKSQELSNGL